MPIGEKTMHEKTLYPHILAPKPFYQVSYKNISNWNGLWFIELTKKTLIASQLRLLLPDNFLALLTENEQTWEKCYLWPQSILKCMFIVVKRKKK